MAASPFLTMMFGTWRGDLMNDTLGEGDRVNKTWKEGDLMTWHNGEVIILVSLLVIGIFGNSLVLHVYNFRLPGSTVTLVKRTLAFLDLSGLTISIPLVLYMLFDTESWYYHHVCVFTAYFIFWITDCANGVLIMIAVDRYWRICLVNRTGMETRLAKKIFAALLVIFAIENIPCFWLFGKSIIIISQYDVKVTHCYLKTEELKTPLFYVYFTITFIFFLANSLTLSILYFKTIRSLWRHTRIREELFSVSANLPSKGHRSTTKAMKTSIIVFAIITIMYFITYSTYFMTIFMYMFDVGVARNTMTPKLQLVQDIAKLGPMYSHVINPIIYSFTSSVFREAVVSLLLCKPWKGGFVRSSTSAYPTSVPSVGDDASR